MKYLLIFVALLSLSFCEAPPKARPIAVEDAFISIKKTILECLSKSEVASAELKKYATDALATDLKESLNLHKFRENPNDKDVIRKCRREAFIHDTRRRPLQHNIAGGRFLGKKK